MSLESSGNIIADRRFEMALQFFARGEAEAAADLLEQTIEIAEDWPIAHFRLGEIYMSLQQRDAAIQAFSTYLSLDAEDRLGAIIKLSLLGATPRPKNLPAGYVESLFDDYATRFDKALVENLGYRAPWLIADAIEKIRPYRDDTSERILDLGCGTGLAGEAILRRAAWLEGVDMSAGMLEQAQMKKIYHYTAHAEAVSFLQNQAKTYDVILAADVLVYIGALEPLFEAVYKRLAPGGLFAFSTQYTEDGTYLLNADHRYAHNPAYTHSCAAQAGLQCLHEERQFIRHDGAKDIIGQIAVFGRPQEAVAPVPLYSLPKKAGRPRKR